MTILLTGASGFVGQNLQKSFNALDIQINTISYRNINNISVKEDTVIHLAGKAHDLKNTANADEYYSSNYELTKQLYNSFLNSDARKFIFISSVKAAADIVNGILTENAIPNPQTHYGKSKLMAEQYIQSHPLPLGKSYYILRTCMIHGPGNKGNLNLLYNFVKKGIPYPLTAFENQRSFLSIENLCFVINELVVRNDIPTGIYQVADDEALSTNELIRIISSAINKKITLWTIAPQIIIALAKIGDLIKLPLNTERLKKLTENYVVSNEKIKQALHKQMPVNTVAGIIKTIKSF